MSARVCRNCGPYYSTLHDCPTAPLSPAPALTAEEAAPDPSPAEQAEIDRFGVFDQEVTVERMARAMWQKDPDGPWEGALDEDRDYFRMLATAALTALRGDRAPLAGQHTTDDARLVRIGQLADRLGKQGLTDEQITAVLLITRPDLMRAGQHTTDEEG